MATPSIAMIPSGYKDGKVYSVLPNSSDGDFTFSRGSAATRVNAQGLVENVQIISSELVSNGNFSQIGTEEVTNGDFATDSDWTLTQAIISNGSASFATTDGSFAGIRQTVFSVGKTYLISLDVSNLVGTIEVNTNGGASIGLDITTDGTKSFYMKAESVDIEIKRKFGAEQVISATIDNVSVKEVGQNWDLGTGWSVDQSNSKVIGDGTSFTYVTQSPILLQNKKIKLTFDISDYVSGTFRLLPTDRQDGLDERFSGNGSYEVVYTSTIDIFRFQQQAFNGSISNISVKEITDDTDLPRLDYSDGSCPSLLLEPQSTNLIPYSEDFSDASWVKSNSTIVSNSIISPSGALNSDKLVESNSSLTHGINFNYFNTSDMSFSVFAKAAERTFIQLQAGGVGSTDSVFNLSNGTIFIEEANATANIEDYGNGWYRCSVSYSSSGANNPTIKLYNGGDIYQGDGTSGLYIWGAQLEQQSYATSYIPTNGAIATRLADAATNSGNASLINSTEGVLYAEIAALADDGTFRFLGLSDGSNNNRVVMLYYTSANKIRAIVSSGGTKYVDVNYQLTNILDFHKIAIKYSLNDFALWIDGVEVITDTILNAPIGLDRLDFLLSGANNFYGKTKAVAVWKEALTDAELIELTTI